MTTKDIETIPHAQPTPPPPPPPDPEPGAMWLVLTMHGSITEPIVNDLMKNICLNLQTVTHLINHAEIKANVNGVILTYSADILPAMTGNLEPKPQWVETGEQTVNV